RGGGGLRGPRGGGRRPVRPPRARQDLRALGSRPVGGARVGGQGHGRDAGSRREESAAPGAQGRARRRIRRSGHAQPPGEPTAAANDALRIVRASSTSPRETTSGGATRTTLPER